MSNSRSINLTGVLALAASALIGTSAFATEDNSEGFTDVSLLWYIGGSQKYFACEVPPTALGSTQASCHTHQVLDLQRNEVIGVAIDATTDVFPAGDDALYATGTTSFTITSGPLAGSTLQVRGTGTIQPVVVGQPHFEWKTDEVETENTPISHIAGIFPDPDENMVLNATGALAGATGTFALFGGLDVASSPVFGSFNCIFKMDLRVPTPSLLTDGNESR